MSTKLEDDAQEAILRLVAHSEEQALAFLIANFTGLIAAMVDQQNGQGDGEIRIEGVGENARDITIHARKNYVQPAQSSTQE